MQREPIAERARGRWRAILAGLGLHKRYLENRHGPCPQCGGKDRYRFDDKDGRGTWYCNQCGAGDGMQMAEFVTGQPFKEAVKMVEAQLGCSSYEIPKPDRSEEELRDARVKLWQAGRPLSQGDPVETYLNSRRLSGLGLGVLRYVPECWHAESRKKLPAMVAAVQGPDGKVCALHKTYLTLDGQKAAVKPVRKLTEGTLPAGACVRLRPHQGDLGLGEGIESAMGADRLAKIPVWASLTADLMRKFEPPADVNSLTVFMDNDASFTGQAAGYHLLNRLWHKAQRDGSFVVGLREKVPMQLGKDYGDIWADLVRANQHAEQRRATG